MDVRAVIFDLDGLLTDTESLHMCSYQKVLRKYEIDLSDQEYVDHWITNGLGIGEFVQKNAFNLDHLQLRREKSRLFHHLLKTDLRLMPYAQEILQDLFGKKKLALASSSSRDNVDAVLGILNLAHYFEVIVSGSEVDKSKPAPDIFLLAAKRLGVRASECIVLEDAQKGVLAANRAGMKVIAIPSAHTSGNDFSTADYVMNSLRDAEKMLLESGELATRQGSSIELTHDPSKAQFFAERSGTRLP